MKHASSFSCWRRSSPFVSKRTASPSIWTAAGELTFAELEENEEDLKKLATWLEKIRKLDFHSASLATDSRERLAHCEALLKAFAQQVFDARDELPPPRARKS